jgi:hypothetical protein
MWRVDDWPTLLTKVVSISLGALGTTRVLSRELKANAHLFCYFLAEVTSSLTAEAGKFASPVLVGRRAIRLATVVGRVRCLFAGSHVP